MQLELEVVVISCMLRSICSFANGAHGFDAGPSHIPTGQPLPSGMVLRFQTEVSVVLDVMHHNCPQETEPSWRENDQEQQCHAYGGYLSPWPQWED
jgi:hypothetical protein